MGRMVATDRLAFLLKTRETRGRPLSWEEWLNPARDREREVERLQERLTRMGKAFLRINENFDFTAVLRGVPDGARPLTGARYGLMTLLEYGGWVRDRQLGFSLPVRQMGAGRAEQS